MGLCFHKRLRLGKGLLTNLSKTAGSLSIARRGLTTNIGRKGLRKSFGLPGSGLSYQAKLVKLGRSITPAHVVTALAILVIIRALMQAR
jgi:hypothetical protein